ncbi:MAG: UDP-glucose 4-epimerase GalE [Flavobacteriales bacterium]|nr:UDP-glucose 4-epimerase GalE [Flavobacteriales bacterium]
MKTQQVIVTGGAGYIGSHTVVELVRAGFEPIIVDNFSNSHPRVLDGLERILNQKIQLFEVDCCDESALNSVFESCLQHGRIAGIIHFAAFKAVGESIAEPLKYFTNNIGSTAALLATMHRHGVGPFVFSSSCTVYGQPKQIPVDETAPFLPAESPYGYTKQACERLITDTHSAHSELNIALLRYFNPIGAHPSGYIGELPLGHPNNLIPFLTQATAGLRDPLTVFGNDYPTTDGTCVRDYIHVVDLAKAHVAALIWLESQKHACEALNLGTGKGSTVLQVIEAFESANGIPVPYSIGPRRPGDVTAIYADAKKAKDLLGWECEHSLEEALKDSWNWQKELGQTS